MNIPVSSETAPLPEEPSSVAPAVASPTRPLYWSVRREIWENRSIYIAPLAAAGAMLIGSLISTLNLAHRMQSVPAASHVGIAQPYYVAAIVIMVTAFLVAVFYCLDALHGERHDRSILFWKSLPVSDRTTVLAKAGIPLVVLPLVTFVVIFATQLLMLLSSTLIHSASGLAATTHWSILHDSVVLLYGIAVLALWYAPIYGWLLLVSAWAQRVTFLWAVMPPLALCIIEKVSFNTSYLYSLLKSRLTGVFAQAISVNHLDGMSFEIIPEPMQLLSGPGFWIGLAAAAAFLALTIRLRRYRAPI
jgi:ABC-2 type transport system permease protein